MKKTLALITAIVIAALSISTLSICAFAEPTTAEATAEATEAPTAAETTTAIDLGHPTRPGQNETSTAKADDATQATADANIICLPAFCPSILSPLVDVTQRLRLVAFATLLDSKGLRKQVFNLICNLHIPLPHQHQE